MGLLKHASDGQQGTPPLNPQASLVLCPRRAKSHGLLGARLLTPVLAAPHAHHQAPCIVQVEAAAPMGVMSTGLPVTAGQLCPFTPHPGQPLGPEKGGVPTPGPLGALFRGQQLALAKCTTSVSVSSVACRCDLSGRPSLKAWAGWQGAGHALVSLGHFSSRAEETCAARRCQGHLSLGQPGHPHLLAGGFFLSRLSAHPKC